MTTSLAGDTRLTEAFAIIEDTTETEVVIGNLRELLDVDHVVYHSSKFGTNPSADMTGHSLRYIYPYVRLTYPASWIKRYIQMGYVDIDPVLREGFQRTLPFDWAELTI